jgi:hypothetical protein
MMADTRFVSVVRMQVIASSPRRISKQRSGTNEEKEIVLARSPRDECAREQ